MTVDPRIVNLARRLRPEQPMTMTAGDVLAFDAAGAAAVRERDSLALELEGWKQKNRKDNEYLIARAEQAEQRVAAAQQALIHLRASTHGYRPDACDGCGAPMAWRIQVRCSGPHRVLTCSACYWTKETA